MPRLDKWENKVSFIPCDAYAILLSFRATQTAQTDYTDSKERPSHPYDKSPIAIAIIKHIPSETDYVHHMLLHPLCMAFPAGRYLLLSVQGVLFMCATLGLAYQCVIIWGYGSLSVWLLGQHWCMGYQGDGQYRQVTTSSLACCHCTHWTGADSCMNCTELAMLKEDVVVALLLALCRSGVSLSLSFCMCVSCLMHLCIQEQIVV